MQVNVFCPYSPECGGKMGINDVNHIQLKVVKSLKILENITVLTILYIVYAICDGYCVTPLADDVTLWQ